MKTAIEKMTREAFLALEATSQEKHEFYQGEVFAMAGGTFNHSVIGLNVTATLKAKLHGKSCQPMNSDMCIGTPGGLLTYPDASVVCGKPKLSDNQRILLNPVLIVEVLSPSTCAYDRGDKFRSYRTILTFRDYLMIDSEKIYVEYFRKIENNAWIFHEYTCLTEKICLGSLVETIGLSELYEGVNFLSVTSEF
ncbi:MAG: hypothetical protein BWK79_13745 [Beggiatoa sp. IS2]|nr:MAG: hypothetical protein BWK79_13745 [Beggiatoa sp. IS2]